jgi:hypothetical protein
MANALLAQYSRIADSACRVKMPTEMVCESIRDAFAQHQPVVIILPLDQIQLIFTLSISNYTMNHIIRGTPDAHWVTGVPIEKG